MTTTMLLSSRVPARTPCSHVPWGAVPGPAARPIPPRSVPESWPETDADFEDGPRPAGATPFKDAGEEHRAARAARGRNVLLLAARQFAGETWQQRWRNSPLAKLAGWPAGSSRPGSERNAVVILDGSSPSSGVLALVSADVIRPDPAWLLTRTSATHARRSWPSIETRKASPPGGADRPGHLGRQAGLRLADQIATIILAKGGKVADITVGDCLELRALRTAVMATGGGRSLFYLWLKTWRSFRRTRPRPSATSSAVRSGQRRRARGPLPPAVPTGPRPDRGLPHRTPALPGLHVAWKRLSRNLARLFWADLERHHPGIDSLRLPPNVAAAWKERVADQDPPQAPAGRQLRRDHHRTAERDRGTERGPGLLPRHRPVGRRGAGTLGAWVAPCPVKEAELFAKKRAPDGKARMDQRTRERLPVLPALVEAADRQLKEARHAA